MTQTLLLTSIRIDGGTQARVEISESTVADYAAIYRHGPAKLPPVVVFFDGATNWLADGFHRYHGSKRAGLKTIECEVREGTCRDAILYSLGANATHGLQRTNEDKRKAVQTLLDDKEWARMSDREIAKACGVAISFVSSRRSQFIAARQAAARERSAVKIAQDKDHASDMGVVGLHPCEQDGLSKRLDCAGQAPEAATPGTDDPTATTPDPAHPRDLTPDELVAQESAHTLKELERLGKILDDAPDPLKAAMAENQRLTRIIEGQDSRIRGLISEKNEAIREVQKLRRQVARLEKVAA